MGDMAHGETLFGLWSWCAALPLDAAEVRDALSGALGRPVFALGDASPSGALLVDIWQTGGDFPTLIECFLTPGDVTESTIASAVAVRLGCDLLLPDDSADPVRYIRAEPDGTLRPVLVDEIETDEGTERRNVRPCDGTT